MTITRLFLGRLFSLLCDSWVVKFSISQSSFQKMEDKWNYDEAFRFPFAPGAVWGEVVEGGRCEVRGGRCWVEVEVELMVLMASER